MTNTSAPAAALLVRKAYQGYVAQKEIRNADRFIQAQMVGQRVELRPGTVVTVSSVTNVGFNGFQVGGYTAEGQYQIACFR